MMEILPSLNKILAYALMTIKFIEKDENPEFAKSHTGQFCTYITLTVNMERFHWAEQLCI